MRGERSRGRSRAHDVAIYVPFASALYGSILPDRPGGAELQATLLARELARRGISVAHIVYPVSNPRRLDPPVPTVVERPPWRGGGVRGLVGEARAVWSSLTTADAQVNVVRGSGGHLIPAAAFCRARARRLVFSASNDLDFDRSRADRSGAMVAAYAHCLRHADRIVVQTSDQRATAVAAFPTLAPILIPSFAEPAAVVSPAADFFLWADRLVEYKRPELLFELAAAVPEARFRMVVAPTSETGSGLAEAIESEAARLSNLELVGPRPREQLMEEVERSAGVVSTSRVEGMPNTFLEAWARGVPVLSLGVDPDARITDHGLGVFADESMEQLASGARELWGDADLRAAIGGRAREFVRSHHSPQAVADRWEALLRALLTRRV